MEQEKQNGQQKTVPVYLSFKTFQSAVQSLRVHGLPSELDRSAFGSRSGAEQTQILSAFRFLGLIDENHQTQESLKSLTKVAEGTVEEKTMLTALLRSRYANAFALNLEAATPAQLDKVIADYGASGGTKERAVRFFLQAVEYAGIKVSSRLTARRPRSSSGSASDGESTTQQNSHRTQRRRRTPDTPQLQSNGQQMMTVELRDAGGTLTLSGTFSPFDLEGDERTFFYEIVDAMKKYKREHTDDEEA